MPVRNKEIDMREICIGVLPVFIGFILDCLLGDPGTMPHPVRLIGSLITGLESRLLPLDIQKNAVSEGALSQRQIRRTRRAGMLLVVSVLVISTAIPALALYAAYRLHIWAGVAVESIFCYYLIAARCLRDESMKVYMAFHSGREDSLASGRQAVSMIVGRDTRNLDAEGVIRATVETVAENTSDGVTAPLFYMAFGGGVLGFFYKAANTMDSMIGYQNERYLHFGSFAARLDDVLNYIPSRLTAVLMIAAAWLLHMDGAGALRVWKRDRRKHKSPNAAQTESVCAGALGVMLAGDASYFGRLYKKETIGDDKRPVEPEDIRRADRLMYVTAVLMLVLTLLVRGIIFGWLGRDIWQGICHT